MWTLTLDDLRDGLAEAERLAADAPVSQWAERVARGRRWLALGGDRERFAAVAGQAATSIDDPNAWLCTWIAGLWHLAGDREQSRAWAQRALGQPHITEAEQTGAWYLLGEYPRLASSGLAAVAAQLATVRSTGDVAPLGEIRAGLLRDEVPGSFGPAGDYHGDPLTNWDWIEETFLLEAELTDAPPPTYEQMLRRLGVLSDAPRQGPPASRSPALGLRVEGDEGVELDVVAEDDVRIRVRPDLIVWLRWQFGRWGASLLQSESDSGEWIVEPVYADWRHAASEAARIVGRDDDQAGGLIASVAIAADGDAGPPRPSPTPPAPEPVTPGLPTIEFSAPEIIYLQLADDLYVDLRDSPQGWNARVAPGFIDRRVDAIPPGPATWQEAAHLLVGWLQDHRDGAGVAALEQLLEDPQAYATR